MTHTIQRRQFLKQGATLASAFLLANEAFANKKGNIISMQLYSVRDEMKQDPIATLKALAEMGYRDCEHAGYANKKFYGFSPEEFKRILNDLGMTMQSGHTVLGKNHWNDSQNDFTDDWKKTIEDAVTVGQKYLISPWLDVSLRKNFDDLKHFMDVFNRCGELCQKAGLRFGYHNHDFEFSLKLTSQRVYDIILEYADPKLVAQQMDIGNMVNGGGRAEELMKQYPNRFELMHVKDIIKTDKGTESTTFGDGIVDVEKIVKLGAKQGGTSYFIIEQESYQGKTPLECMKTNLERLNKYKF